MLLITAVAEIEAQFSRNMQMLGPWPEPLHMAVACSGGADSMALALLLKGWSDARAATLTALVIDHGLRAESANEARLTAEQLAQHAISSHIIFLNLDAGPGLQERARNARYDALLDYCRAKHITHLFLGHHADDQIETTLFRLLRGSGPHGLAGMSAKRASQQGGVWLIRPLLNIAANSLRSYLRACGQEWIDDPSNANTGFRRVHIRQWLAKQTNVTQRQKFSDIIYRFGCIRSCDELYWGRALQSRLHLLPGGVSQIDKSLWDWPETSRLWALGRILCLVSGKKEPVRQAKLALLSKNFLENPKAAVSLHQCLIWGQKDALWIAREPKHVAATIALEAGQSGSWDGRFEYYTAAKLPQSCQLGALGTEGWRYLKTIDAPTGRYPHRAALSLPALRVLERIVAVPHMEYYAAPQWQEAIRLAFSPAKALADVPFFVMNEAAE